MYILSDHPGVDLRMYLRSLRKNWWVVVATVVLCAGGAAIWTLQTPPTYASKVTFFVTTPNVGTNSPLSGDQFGQQRVNSYVQLAQSDRLASMVLVDTGLRLTPRTVTQMVSADADINTVLLTTTVMGTDPEVTLKIAKSISTQLVKLVHDIETQDGKRASPVQLDVVSGPSLLPDPVSPNKKKDVGAGLAIGLILGLGLAALRELTDATIRSTEALQVVSGHPALGVIPHERHIEKSPLILSGQGGAARAEAFRQLRTSLQFLNVDRPTRTLVVTSSTAGEGKSLTSTSLALVFAEAGRRVLLVEADMRRPKLCDYLGLERVVGLSNVLAGQVPLEDAVQQWGNNDFHVLASGSIPPNPSELLGSHNMHDLLRVVERDYDMVILDTPPLLPVTDAAVLAAQADGAVMVVRHGKTKRSQVEAAVRSLDVVGARLLGSVLTMTPTKGVDASVTYEGYAPHEDQPRSITRGQGTRKSRHSSGPRQFSVERMVSPRDGRRAARNDEGESPVVPGDIASRPFPGSDAGHKGRRTAS